MICGLLQILQLCCPKPCSGLDFQWRHDASALVRSTGSAYSRSMRVTVVLSSVKHMDPLLWPHPRLQASSLPTRRLVELLLRRHSIPHWRQCGAQSIAGSSFITGTTKDVIQSAPGRRGGGFWVLLCSLFNMTGLLVTSLPGSDNLRSHRSGNGTLRPLYQSPLVASRMCSVSSFLSATPTNRSIIFLMLCRQGPLFGKSASGSDRYF